MNDKDQEFYGPYSQEDQMLAVQLQAICGDLKTLAAVVAYASRRGLDPLYVAKAGFPSTKPGPMTGIQMMALAAATAHLPRRRR